MKRSGPTNKETRGIIVSLEKTGKSTGKKIWRDLSNKLKRASRQRASVNVFQINKHAKKNKGKVLVIPGKLLGTGDIEEKAEVACLNYSESAKKKIEAKKGKVMTLGALINSKTDASKMVIIQ